MYFKIKRMIITLKKKNYIKWKSVVHSTNKFRKESEIEDEGNRWKSKPVKKPTWTPQDLLALISLLMISITHTVHQEIIVVGPPMCLHPLWEEKKDFTIWVFYKKKDSRECVTQPTKSKSWAKCLLYIEREKDLERSLFNQSALSSGIVIRTQKPPTPVTALTAFWTTDGHVSRTLFNLVFKTSNTAAVLSARCTCWIICFTFSSSRHYRDVIQLPER